MKTRGVLVLLMAVGMSVGQEPKDRGKELMRHECVACHSLRMVETQRLAKAAWERELNKMAGWGAELSDRQALLDYLAAEYTDQKPLPAGQMTGDGRK